MSNASRLADTPWTPAMKAWHAKRFPKSWDAIKDRLPEPKPEPVKAIPAALRACKPPPQLGARIVALCAEAAGVPVEDVIAGNRRRGLAVVRARKAAAYLIHQHCHNHTFTMIGQRIGIINCTSVKHFTEQVEDDLQHHGGEHFGAIIAHVEEALACTE